MDYASATPLVPEARCAMERYWSQEFYNPFAIYAEGERVRVKLESWRRLFAKELGVGQEGVIFTSGGTESNFLALTGLPQGSAIVSEDAHPSVLESLVGREVLVWKKGEPLPWRDDTVVVSALALDNSLGRLVRAERRRRGGDWPLLHLDASQSASYRQVGLETLSADLLTIDSAKLYGPKGVGALVVRRGVRLGLPPRGTPPIPLIAGFAKAFELAIARRESEVARLEKLTLELASGFEEILPEASVKIVLPNIVYLSQTKVLPEYLVLALEREGVLVSAGPACASKMPEPPETPVRFSLGLKTTAREIKFALEALGRVVKSW